VVIAGERQAGVARSSGQWALQDLAGGPVLYEVLSVRTTLGVVRTRSPSQSLIQAGTHHGSLQCNIAWMMPLIPTWVNATESVGYAALPKNMVAAVEATIGAMRVRANFSGGTGRRGAAPAHNGKVQAGGGLRVDEKYIQCSSRCSGAQVLVCLRHQHAAPGSTEALLALTWQHTKGCKPANCNMHRNCRTP
jgi:hypothetical protein